MSEKAAEQARSAFAQRFGREPEGVSFAPGRVNLIGDHVDYNDGLVLPMPIAQGTAVAWAKSGTTETTILAADLDQEGTFGPEAVGADGRAGWRAYCAGMLQLAAEYAAAPTLPVQPMEMAISGDLPRGSGLSSSASLCIAIGRAIAASVGVETAAESLSRTAQRVEHDFAGVKCGIMDQMAVAAGRAEHALLLDCRDLTYRNIAMPDGWEVAIIESGVTRALVDGAYNQRRSECDSALSKLGMLSWREASLTEVSVADLTGTERRRARHIVSEIDRVEAAASAIEAANLTHFGELLAASHTSLRDDFETSHPAVDALVARIQNIVGDEGSARITGAGFGGAIVAIASADRIMKLDQLDRAIIRV